MPAICNASFKNTLSFRNAQLFLRPGIGVAVKNLIDKGKFGVRSTEDRLTKFEDQAGNAVKYSICRLFHGHPGQQKNRQTIFTGLRVILFPLLVPKSGFKPATFPTCNRDAPFSRTFGRAAAAISYTQKKCPTIK